MPICLTCYTDIDLGMYGSPKCKAWCRWNQFASRSHEMAQKVMEAQSEDQIHLLVCEAVFVFQCGRGSGYHCHLEQPEVMQLIVPNTLHARCDLCKAGLSKHPTTHRPRQNGTQILTTSRLMHRYVDTLRCPQNHVQGISNEKMPHVDQSRNIPNCTHESLVTRSLVRSLPASAIHSQS